ncbi:MAG: O-antigen ligase family protein [Candidatus Doudnabacteria bacterium]|nr:O-antigen ligase family protein [Candidatus Doudnabacteria bacterium]
MNEEFLKRLKALPRLKLLIIVFVVWQYVSILGMAILNWSTALVWLNLGLLLAFILLAPIYESLLLLVLSIPFFVAVPNSKFDALSMWRILYLALFAVWLVREKKLKIQGIIFLPWDKYLAWFASLGLVLALIFGSFRLEAVKQVLFWLNIYFLYIVLINTLKSKQQIFEFIRYAIWSLAIIVTLGFTQLFGTFLTNLDVFWVYWANNITKLYYGQNFSLVALYSNSWFSYYGGRDLRMFSIMPDSQSFAYICIIALCMGTALTRSVFTHIKKWLWSGIRFAGLALILSGTRAVWVGMALPFLAVVAAYAKGIQKHLVKKYMWPFAIIFILFIISPFINKALGYLRVERFQENFLERAQSIYNINETSNRGRIEMWQNSSLFFLTHPWGVGFSNFIVSFNEVQDGQNYNQVGEKLNTAYNLPAKYISAHSLYLQILVETGIVGFLIFAAFWTSVLQYLWRFIRHYEKTEDFLVYFVAQAFLMVLWILASAVFDITLLNDKVLMYFLINLGLAGLIVKRYQEYKEEGEV